MKRTLFLLFSYILYTSISGAQGIGTLDNLKTVYSDDNVTFREIDENTWLGSGNVMSSESLYLLKGNDRAILIDAGTSIPKLDSIAQMITGKPVTLVLTHVHPDHAGSVEGFEEIWINPGDTVNVPLFMPDYKGNVRYLENGKTINMGNRSLEIYFTPGHTPGSVTFLEKGTDRGYCGDAFGTSKGILVFAGLEVILDTCRDAYRYFSDQGYKRFYCGHFFGDNLITLDRLQAVEKMATEVLDGTIDAIPAEGVLGLNTVAIKDGFKMSFIK